MPVIAVPRISVLAMFTTLDRVIRTTMEDVCHAIRVLVQEGQLMSPAIVRFVIRHLVDAKTMMQDLAVVVMTESVTPMMPAFV